MATTTTTMTTHGHGHDHDVTQHDPEAAERNKVPFYGKRIYAIRELLIEKGILTRDEIQAQIEYMEARTPANGARLVARAWVDPAFKQRLLSDPKAACAEMGIDASSLTEFVVLENTDNAAQPGGLHVVLVLPAADPGSPARLVQELRVPVARGGRAARHHARVRDRARRRCGGTRRR